MKVLLVDDEAIEREGLRDYMPWKQLGLEVRGEASDGKQAIKLVNDIKPDIIISDIKMPGMDGIELATYVKKEFPEIKIIFISGHQEFEYARQAITLNAFGYVLKPVNFNRLSELLRKVIDQIKEEQYSEQEKEELRKQIQENRYYLQQQFLLELLTQSKRYQIDILRKRAEYLGISCPYKYFSVAVVSIDDYTSIEESLSEESKQFLNTIVFNLLKGLTIKGMEMEVVQVKPGVVTIIMNTPENISIVKDNMIAAYEKFLRQLSKSHADTATVGISDFYSGMEEIQLLYRHALAALKAKWTLGKGQIIFSSDISIGPSTMLDSQNYSEQIHEISQYILAGDSVISKESLHTLFDNLKSEAGSSQLLIRNISLILISECRQILLEIDENPEKILGSYFSIYDTIFNIETMKGLQTWLSDIFLKVTKLIQERRNAKNTRLVESIMEIVGNRYHENIGMDDISAEVFFSSNYIRKIFKDETGQTISDYLLQVRMKHALELMKDPELHVYDIGKRVGYENTSYFCQVFKQYHGVTPKEYMNSLKR